MAELKLISVT